MGSGAHWWRQQLAVSAPSNSSPADTWRPGVGLLSSAAHHHHVRTRAGENTDSGFWVLDSGFWPQTAPPGAMASTSSSIAPCSRGHRRRACRWRCARRRGEASVGHWRRSLPPAPRTRTKRTSHPMERPAHRGATRQHSTRSAKKQPRQPPWRGSCTQHHGVTCSGPVQQ